MNIIEIITLDHSAGGIVFHYRGDQELWHLYVAMILEFTEIQPEAEFMKKKHEFFRKNGKLAFTRKTGLPIAEIQIVEAGI